MHGETVKLTVVFCYENNDILYKMRFKDSGVD